MNATYVSKIVTAVFLTTHLVGCATTHSGTEVKSSQSPLVVSCDRRSDLGTDKHKFYTCTFENKGQEWLPVKIKEVSFDNTDDKTARLLTAAETTQFMNAYSAKLAQEKHNTDMLLMGLALGGVVVAGVGSHNNNSDAVAGGLATTAGATVAQGVRDVSKSYNDAQHDDISQYGDDHMMGPEFKLPAELFVKKTILAELGHADKLPDNIKICFEKPAVECLTASVKTTKMLQPNEEGGKKKAMFN